MKEWKEWTRQTMFKVNEKWEKSLRRRWQEEEKKILVRSKLSRCIQKKERENERKKDYYSRTGQRKSEKRKKWKKKPQKEKNNAIWSVCDA